MPAKRNNLSASGNSLLNYFTRSPTTPKSDRPAANPMPSPLTAKPSTPTSSKTGASARKAKETKKSPAPKKLKIESEDDDDDEEEVIKSNGKRKISRIIDSDSDYECDTNDENESDNSQIMDVDDVKQRRKSANGKPAAKKKIKLDTDTAKTSFMDKLKANIGESSALSEVKENNNTDIADVPVVWRHQKLDFLKPGQILDATKKRPDDPNYDPTTLFVPTSYLDSLTPGMRQWWVLKSQHFDTILFFKVGKFYELYHMDAEVGVRELGFTFMKGEYAHSGFPEQAFNRMSTSLVERGYKVARIEQTETPAGMEERTKKMKKATKFDKVVSREVCQVINKGTQVFGQQIAISNEFKPNYMLAIAEKVSSNGRRFGVAFIDTSIGEFNIGEFDDDKQCSRLLTLISHNPPVLVLSERGAVSIELQQVFKEMLSNALREVLLPDSQFWNAEKTLKQLSDKYYGIGQGKEWPEVIRITQNSGDHLGLTANTDYRLALKALGGCLWYLTKCVIDEQIMAMAHFTLYTPPDVKIDDLDQLAAEVAKKNFNKHMVLDSITLSNLKIVGDERSLFNTLDQCCTKFGKRLLHYWICSPSCEPTVIVERQQAIQELMDKRDQLSDARSIMGALPDLERQLAQIHTFGNKNRAFNHPDGRAVLFEQKTYNKKKIQDLVSTINGFDALVKIPKIFAGFTSTLIKRLTQFAPNGEFPDFKETITFFKNGFDFDEALKEGVIAPGKGVDSEYDSIQKRIAEINEELAEYLKKQEKFFGCRLQYVGKDRNRFEIEVPEKEVKKANNRYHLEGQRKGKNAASRYTTEETRQLRKELMQVEDERNVVLKDLLRRMFEKFSTEYDVWKKVIDCVSILDCLTSFTVYGQNQSQICFPKIVDNNNGPVIEIDEGIHPCMKFTDDFIPNGISLGGETTAPLAILTGPNMGGKSTLMRQVGLLVIMSQIGAPIPAVSAKISLIDRIFTRLGAQDDILAGHSTFLVELSETSAILKHATVNSLVLLDELGRGTATYDGTAIAAAVVDFLANLKCRTLFSTHYHNLVDNFHNDQRITLGHMACMVESEGDDDPTKETVTFLYKYTDGACPKSYGFNAAKLAGMPASIIKRAYEYSKKVELIALKRKLFSKVLTSGDLHDIKELLLKIKKCAI
ncbi:probable DNA mismatch repair protein Msh6 [Sitodiplosis mosellana]|uniref:probable DNA mismatch repair protein Msh6 n=1 Tax=Sitodiplosis mosellana TaxID=263140 RepID=UPI002443F78E|nr:probable DNA mismatch repair protein Msh6 [Sitodiplosis mosellana]